MPEALRARVLLGLRATMKLEGSDKAYPAVLRYVSSDAAFTPYFSLNERDRSRLAYLAKVYVQGDTAMLPTGAPVVVDFPSLHQ